MVTFPSASVRTVGMPHPDATRHFEWPGIFAGKIFAGDEETRKATVTGWKRQKRTPWYVPWGKISHLSFFGSHLGASFDVPPMNLCET